jgi:hypothetical protein
VASLVSAQNVLQDETQLFGMIGELSRSQAALLTYYFAMEGRAPRPRDAEGVNNLADQFRAVGISEEAGVAQP